ADAGHQPPGPVLANEPAEGPADRWRAGDHGDSAIDDAGRGRAAAEPRPIQRAALVWRDQGGEPDVHVRAGTASQALGRARQRISPGPGAVGADARGVAPSPVHVTP